MKTRIVKRKYVDGGICYVIQQKHFIFRWWWVDAWVNSYPITTDTFKTLQEAKDNLCYFNGSKVIDEVIIN